MEQLALAYGGRGGARKGAGRPRKRDAGVSHLRRAELTGREPVHVTLGLLDHVYNLRTRRCFEALRPAFEAVASRDDFRVVGLCIQDRHLHLLEEAASAQALAAGMHELKRRVAQALHAVMGRGGPVFSERYHEHVLRSPAEVLAAQRYVLQNTAKHAAELGRIIPAGYRDPYAIGYFGDRVFLPAGTEGMVRPPETWLLQDGWRLAAAPRVACVPRGGRAGPGAELPLLALCSPLASTG